MVSLEPGDRWAPPHDDMYTGNLTVDDDDDEEDTEVSQLSTAFPCEKNEENGAVRDSLLRCPCVS